MSFVSGIGLWRVLDSNLGRDNQARVRHSIVNQPDQLRRVGERVDRAHIHAECFYKVVPKREREVARVQTTQGTARRVCPGNVQPKYAEPTLPPRHPDRLLQYNPFSRPQVRANGLEPDGVNSPRDPVRLVRKDLVDGVRRVEADGDRADRPRQLEPRGDAVDDVDGRGAAQHRRVGRHHADGPRAEYGDRVARLEAGVVEAAPPRWEDVGVHQVLERGLGRV